MLVVDDEPDNLDLLYRAFHREFIVLRAENGPAALDILAEEKDVAVIISDQRMPLMSGTEFLSLTATQYPDVIRIILTGYTDVEDLVEAINTGKVFKYVTKPWDDAELKAVVHQAIDTHNVLKARTRELRRALRQESLLNTVNQAIRGAVSSHQILQTIVDTVGQMFETDCCILRAYHNRQLDNESFLYVSPEIGDRLFSANRANSLAGDASGSELGQSIDLSGLIHTVWHVAEVQVIDDVQTDARTCESSQIGVVGVMAYQTAQIRSSLIVPLICQQELLAVLALHQCQQVRQWRDDDVRLVTLVADQAALALAQTRTYERVQALATREALVNSITTAIRSSLDPQNIFAAITQQLGQALHVDGCALSLWTEGDRYVRCVGLHDATLQSSNHLSTAHDPNEWQGETWVSPFMLADQRHAQPPVMPATSVEGDRTRPLPQSLAPIEGNPVLQQLIATQAPVIIDDLSQQPEMNATDLPVRLPARALLVVPLLSDGSIIGSISLRQIRQPRRWHPEEVELTQAVASQAAIAVQQSRLYQTMRQQAEQLLELDRQKTEFFQNISHEFRTPLTLNIGPLEEAVAQNQGLDYEQSVIALRNSRRLLRLVNQLLDLQRLDAGRMQSCFRPCHLADFIRQVVESFRPYSERKQIQLSVELENCPPVYLDLEKFDKVLYNLLSNAMKFTSRGGSIRVMLSSIGDRCLLKVQDTGIGIEADQIPHLFERFRQADGSANRSFEGSGLGLALVKELVELHGGHVEVESTFGEGTTFTVWLQLGTAHLPVNQIVEIPAEIEHSRALVELADVELDTVPDRQARLDAPVHAESSLNLMPHGDSVPVPESLLAGSVGAAQAPAHILIVDDNPDLRNYVSTVLEKAGYQVTAARNGADGIEILTNTTPQLIVTDLMMPIASGLELIRYVRHHEAIKGIPIILLTAKADEETRIEGTEKGADAYLSKPFNHRELLAEVRNLLALKANERRVAELNTYLTESVLKRFLPPQLVKKAARGELALDLRPEPRLVTVLFSDIIGFTQLSNTLRSRRVAELLNEYLSEMTRVIFDHGGTVDKFMGDAILALFGAPEELTPNEQVKRAIAAARQMYQALDRLNAKWQTQGISRVQFRCGIHQGTAVVGMFGGDERTDYTAIGPSVNIAARIQEAAEPNCILVSAAVADYLEEDMITKFSPLELRGVDETVLTFAIKPYDEASYSAPRVNS
jgi:signal transduction histidine kinase/class 3 adenylate cyclase